MEFDCFQPYFFEDFDTEEDFYKSTAPSEDIWKKFELLPTPPMSPTHRTLHGGGGGVTHVSPGDQLNWLDLVLGQDDDKQLDKVNNERLSAIQTHRGPPPAAHVPGRASKAQCAAPDASPLAPALATHCVDPAAVLTIPANNCRKPASSGSESRSDSSDDDDEEEIDVVTVESKQNRGRLARTQKAETITVRADPCPKRFHLSIHRQQHNYAAPSPDSDLELDDDEDDEDDDDEDDDDDDEQREGGEDEDEPQRKRSCLESSSSATEACRAGSSSSDTPGSSDNEDVDRRRNHNFLERKRRNDLRSRFMALRDEVPGLVESAKTPKVAILTQATEYLAQLHQRERQQAQEKKRLRVRQQQLLRRLVDLRRS
ncbi:hypothetical protein CRUP_019778 [Coryphaenoides rupestris]|nr:hypothetical protein CRUP_019778 [Coryphaenoides rupestris]